MLYNYDYFISYAHADNQPEDGKPGFVDVFVEKLKNSTEHQQMFGEEVKVFFDKEEIHSMSEWDIRIRSCLASSRFFVVLLSPNYFHSEYCAREFDWWMQHEMHRRVLGEGTAPMLIVAVNDLYNFNVDPLPAIPPDIQAKFPKWVNQIRQIQAGPDFDMHNLERTKIDEILRSLCEKTKDKVFKQDIAENSPINAGYPQYNENFVGRRENLRSLRHTLSTMSTTAISAVNGLGGIGKTELALTYGHAFAWDYELGRIFATCENATSLEDVILSSSIAEMHGVELKGTNEQKLTTLYNELKKKIKLIEERNKERCVDRTLGAHLLLILDNVNRLELISQNNLDKLPDFFHVIITTRESANEFPHIHTESVDRLSEDESVELLRNLREFGDDLQEAAAARNIARLLDGFTLAVELTGAFLKKTPYVTYQEQYDSLNADLSDTVQNMVDQTQNLRRHQAECISVVLKSTLSALSDKARKALEFAALMPPEAVGVSWLPELIGLDDNDVEGRKVLSELTSYSLLTPLGGQPKIARIHRLVAETVKKDIPEEVQKEMIAKIRDKCKALLHKDETFWFTPENSWNITPVSEFCLALAEQWTIEPSEEEIDWNLTWMLNQSRNMLHSLGKTNEERNACQLYLKISEERVKTFPDNIDAQQELSYSYNKLGDLEMVTRKLFVARGWYEKAIEIDQRLANLMPDNSEVAIGLIYSYSFLSAIEKTSTSSAQEYEEKVMEIAKRLVDMKSDDDDRTFYNMLYSYVLLGDRERNAGNATTARFFYEKALEINKQLAEKKIDDVDILQFLSITYNCHGDLENDAGNTAAAREWYEKGLEIRKRHADLMPDNVFFQQNLSSSYESLGDLEKAARNTAAAREWYEKELETDQRLAEKAPDNVQVQLDLSNSYNNLGDLENDAGNTAAAREWYKKELEITQRLAEKAPDNIQVQQDLSYSYYNLGNVENDAGNIAAAREWYKKELEIRKRLADKMPENVDVQRDLSISYERLGNLEKDARNTAAAREWYEKELEIRKRLADKIQDNVQVQQDLSYSYNNLGDLEKAARNVAAARKWYEKELEIVRRLAENMPDDVQLQQNLSKSYTNLGDLVEDSLGSFDLAHNWYEKALEITQQLAEKEPDNVSVQKDLKYLKRHLFLNSPCFFRIIGYPILFFIIFIIIRLVKWLFF